MTFLLVLIQVNTVDVNTVPGPRPLHGMCLCTCFMALMWPGGVWGLGDSLQTHFAFHAVCFVFTNRSASHLVATSSIPLVSECPAPTSPGLTLPLSHPPPHGFHLCLQQFSSCGSRWGYQRLRRKVSSHLASKGSPGLPL